MTWRWVYGGFSALVLLICVLIALAACAETPSDDRTETKPDGYQDVTNVVIWRNADDVPNVATFCADHLAFASTLSSDGTKAPQLVRVPEHDSACGAQR